MIDCEHQRIEPASFFRNFQRGVLAGDFDLDRDVDGADFLIWQRGGSPIPGSASDLALWRGNFGASSLFSTSLAVPEPHAAGMTLASAFLLQIARRRAMRDFHHGAKRNG